MRARLYTYACIWYACVYNSFCIFQNNHASNDHEALTENPVILTIEVTIIRNI